MGGGSPPAGDGRLFALADKWLFWNDSRLGLGAIRCKGYADFILKNIGQEIEDIAVVIDNKNIVGNFHYLEATLPAPKTLWGRVSKTFVLRWM